MVVHFGSRARAPWSALEQGFVRALDADIRPRGGAT